MQQVTDVEFRTFQVVIETDSGLSGVGEFCPCGENYMDTHSEGAEAATRPVWMLMGRKLIDGAPMYRVAPQKPIGETLAEMEQHRKTGYRHFTT